MRTMIYFTAVESTAPLAVVRDYDRVKLDEIVFFFKVKVPLKSVKAL